MLTYNHGKKKDPWLFHTLFPERHKCTSFLWLQCQELCSAFLRWHLRHVEVRCVSKSSHLGLSIQMGRNKNLPEGKSAYPKAKSDEALKHSWSLARPALVNVPETAKGGKKGRGRETNKKPMKKNAEIVQKMWFPVIPLPHVWKKLVRPQKYEIGLKKEKRLSINRPVISFCLLINYGLLEST